MRSVAFRPSNPEKRHFTGEKKDFRSSKGELDEISADMEEQLLRDTFGGSLFEMDSETIFNHLEDKFQEGKSNGRFKHLDEHTQETHTRELTREEIQYWKRNPGITPQEADKRIRQHVRQKVLEADHARARKLREHAAAAAAAGVSQDPDDDHHQGSNASSFLQDEPNYPPSSQLLGLDDLAVMQKAPMTWSIDVCFEFTITFALVWHVRFAVGGSITRQMDTGCTSTSLFLGVGVDLSIEVWGRSFGLGLSWKGTVDMEEMTRADVKQSFLDAGQGKFLAEQESKRWQVACKKAGIGAMLREWLHHLLSFWWGQESVMDRLEDFVTQTSAEDQYKHAFRTALEILPENPKAGKYKAPHLVQQGLVLDDARTLFVELVQRYVKKALTHVDAKANAKSAPVVGKGGKTEADYKVLGGRHLARMPDKNPKDMTDPSKQMAGDFIMAMKALDSTDDPHVWKEIGISVANLLVRVRKDIMSLFTSVFGGDPTWNGLCEGFPVFVYPAGFNVADLQNVFNHNFWATGSITDIPNYVASAEQNVLEHKKGCAAQECLDSYWAIVKKKGGTVLKKSPGNKSLRKDAERTEFLLASLSKSKANKTAQQINADIYRAEWDYTMWDQACALSDKCGHDCPKCAGNAIMPQMWCRLAREEAFGQPPFKGKNCQRDLRCDWFHPDNMKLKPEEQEACRRDFCDVNDPEPPIMSVTQACTTVSRKFVAFQPSLDLKWRVESVRAYWGQDREVYVVDRRKAKDDPDTLLIIHHTSGEPAPMASEQSKPSWMKNYKERTINPAATGIIIAEYLQEPHRVDCERFQVPYVLRTLFPEYMQSAQEDIDKMEESMIKINSCLDEYEPLKDLQVLERFSDTQKSDLEKLKATYEKRCGKPKDPKISDSKRLELQRAAMLREVKTIVTTEMLPNLISMLNQHWTDMLATAKVIHEELENPLYDAFHFSYSSSNKPADKAEVGDIVDGYILASKATKSGTGYKADVIKYGAISSATNFELPGLEVTEAWLAGTLWQHAARVKIGYTLGQPINVVVGDLHKKPLLPVQFSYTGDFKVTLAAAKFCGADTSLITGSVTTGHTSVSWAPRHQEDHFESSLKCWGIETNTAISAGMLRCEEKGRKEMLGKADSIEYVRTQHIMTYSATMGSYHTDTKLGGVLNAVLGGTTIYNTGWFAAAAVGGGALSAGITKGFHDKAQKGGKVYESLLLAAGASLPLVSTIIGASIDSGTDFKQYFKQFTQFDGTKTAKEQLEADTAAHMMGSVEFGLALGSTVVFEKLEPKSNQGGIHYSTVRDLHLSISVGYTSSSSWFGAFMDYSTPFKFTATASFDIDLTHWLITLDRKFRTLKCKDCVKTDKAKGFCDDRNKTGKWSVFQDKCPSDTKPKTTSAGCTKEDPKILNETLQTKAKGRWYASDADCDNIKKPNPEDDNPPTLDASLRRWLLRHARGKSSR